MIVAKKKGSVFLKTMDLEEIISAYSNYVFKIVDSISNQSLSYQDKEEILSDTFFLLWKNHKRIKTNLKGYLSVIARNVTYQRLREKNICIDIDKVLPFLAMPQKSTVIEDILSVLSPKEKKLFYSVYIEGYPLKEISKRENKSLSAVKMSVLRLKKKIKEKMKDEFGPY